MPFLLGIAEIFLKHLGILHHIFRDFAQIFKDFALIFDKSKRLAVRLHLLHSSLLHHCTKYQCNPSAHRESTFIYDFETVRMWLVLAQCCLVSITVSNWDCCDFGLTSCQECQCIPKCDSNNPTTNNSLQITRNLGSCQIIQEFKYRK